MTLANRTTHFGPVHASFREKWLCARQSSHCKVLVLILRTALARESLGLEERQEDLVECLIAIAGLARVQVVNQDSDVNGKPVDALECGVAVPSASQSRPGPTERSLGSDAPPPGHSKATTGALLESRQLRTAGGRVLVELVDDSRCRQQSRLHEAPVTGVQHEDVACSVGLVVVFHAHALQRFTTGVSAWSHDSEPSSRVRRSSGVGVWLNTYALLQASTPPSSSILRLWSAKHRALTSSGSQMALNRRSPSLQAARTVGIAHVVTWTRFCEVHEGSSARLKSWASWPT